MSHQSQVARAARTRSERVDPDDGGTSWATPVDALLATLDATADGLTTTEAQRRLARDGPNRVADAATPRWPALLLTRFTSPLVLILLVAASVSLLTRQWADASIVLAIVVLTAVLSFVQEYRATVAVAELRSRVALRSRVLRDGKAVDLDSELLVRGDVVELSAGSIVPADLRVLDAHDCMVNQVLLTGEAEPVEKHAGASDAAALGDRENSLLMGTSLRSGWARALVIDTGGDTVYGRIAGRLEGAPVRTEFEQGLHEFGALLIRVMLAVVALVLAINVVLHRPAVEMLLFAAALAVGLSPELLPAILTVTLSHGARAMARCGVIVKRLDAIENLGSIDVLCTDKTGTLTRGVVQLDSAVDPEGRDDAQVLRLAFANASLQTGLRNSLDDAVIARATSDGATWAPARLGELPYDFNRRRLSVLVDDGDAGSSDAAQTALLLTKGAVSETLSVCSTVHGREGDLPLDASSRAAIDGRFVAWSGQGYRVLAVASRRLAARATTRDDERDMRLEGFLLFLDPPEEQVRGTLQTLASRGVSARMITGDNRHAARHVADAIGMPAGDVLAGSEMKALTDAALAERVRTTYVFAEIDPDQKERIIGAFRRAGCVVGYLGDGINDAAALHAADVGISVDTAVDVAKDAADFVLLRHDLDVLRAGIDEGRRTFANTLKYVFITTSANFGNMLSMAAASLLLPFLPLLAKQILLNNFLSDIPAMGIAGDRIDPEWAQRPHRWDMRRIRRALLVFGLTSTAFDLLTFGLLLGFARRSASVFRTGWFVESLLTELCVLLVIRTRRPFWRSRPGTFLWTSALVVAACAVALPYTPLADSLGFVPLPAGIMLLVIAITVLYGAASEWGKRWFYGRDA